MRLDALTQEEARMAIAQVLKATHGVGEGVKLVYEGAGNAFIQLQTHS